MGPNSYRIRWNNMTTDSGLEVQYAITLQNISGLVDHHPPGFGRIVTWPPDFNWHHRCLFGCGAVHEMLIEVKRYKTVYELEKTVAYKFITKPRGPNWMPVNHPCIGIGIFGHHPSVSIIDVNTFHDKGRFSLTDLIDANTLQREWNQAGEMVEKLIIDQGFRNDPT